MDTGFFPEAVVKYSLMAAMVMLSFVMAAAKSLIRVRSGSMDSLSYSSVSITSCTFMVFSVMVPVLSTHSTSTRASVSMHFISWSRTFFWASRTALTARATLASR